jgi:antitoxin (DNA-binding transcriptional repressor) of toxin-antitoxin stability system
MTIYLAADNNSALSDLIDRALASDGVVVTRNGKAIAEVRAVPKEKKWASNDEMIKWLDEVRITPREGSPTASELLQSMRDGY